MTQADLERLKRPATVIAVCAALFVGFDVFILFLNSLGFDVSVLNQPTTVRRAGRSVRVAGMGLKGWQAFAANSLFVFAHGALLWLALRLRARPTTGRALATALYSMLPCLCPCVFFPLGVWLLAAGRTPRRSGST